MKMLSVERIENLRALGADAGTPGSARAMPQATSTHAPAKVAAPVVTEPAPSSVIKIGQLNKAAHAGVVYANLSNPSLRASGSELAPYDWSIKPGMTAKVEDKPPLAEMLIEHLKSLLVASAAAIQTLQPVDPKANLKAETTPVTDLGSALSRSRYDSPSQVKKPANL